MSGWDGEQVTSVDLRLRSQLLNEFDTDLNGLNANNYSRSDAQNQFIKFIREFRSENGANFPYRDTLRANYQQGINTLEVDCNHIRDFDVKLMNGLRNNPGEYVSLFEEAAKLVAVSLTDLKAVMDPEAGLAGVGSGLGGAFANHPDVQVQLVNFRDRNVPVRTLAAIHVTKLVSVSGIIVSASRPRIKSTRLAIMCRNCKKSKFLECEAGFGGVKLPRQCDTKADNPTNSMGVEKCPLDPYIINPDASLYVDQQRLKLQENMDDIPTGELPRTLSLSVERNLVGLAKPGSRVTVFGMYTTYEAASQSENKRAQGGQSTEAGVRIPYLRAFGITIENASIEEIAASSISQQDISTLEALSRDKSIRDRITASIAPAIFDNDETKNIKQALACQLFGGSRKLLPDGMRLRGDINVLLLGDPSVAKSQFLKFMIQLAPIGVYTSGKGSSAAGLTASVIRDPSSGDFHLEGGALVLADGGLVCIDEFDKMRDQDRVAIHEAMEQQTISIAKAGITTILNSRTAVLAAANPIFGRYDDTRSPSENIDFQTSILSRFDLIFIVRDIQDRARDTMMAKHVINVHRGLDAGVEAMRSNLGTEILDTALLKKYVAYAKHHIQPRLSEQAANELKAQYVNMRTQLAQQRAQEASERGPHSKVNAGSVIPITVRQLEAIIRLSESFARMELRSEATIEDVGRAIELFNVSTYRAATASFGESGIASNEFNEIVKLVEKQIEQRMAIGTKMSVYALKQALKENPQLMDKTSDKGTAEHAIDKGLFNLIKNESIRPFNQGKMIHRVR